MFYIKKLENKDKTEYNGIETYVSECIDKENLSWFPQNESLSLSSLALEDGEDNP